MAFDYDQLKSDIQTWMENSSAELTASADTIIQMMLMSVSKDLNIKALDVYDAATTLTINNPLLTIPNVGPMLGLRSIQVNTTGTTYKTLKHRELTFIDQYWPDRAVTGEPKYYGEYDDTRWIISPTPNASSALRIAYRKRFAALATGQTNWLVTNHYDFALTACLLEASRFVIDDRQNGLIQVNTAQYVRLRDAINAAEKRTTRDEYRRPEINAENAPNAPSDDQTE